MDRGPEMIRLLSLGLTLAFAAALAPGPAQCGAAADEVAASPGYVVVLTDGTVKPVLTEPVIAFGKVRFMSTAQRTEVLSVLRVNVERTRKLNSLVPQHGPRGTFSDGVAAPSGRDEESAERGGARSGSAASSQAPGEDIRRRNRPVTVYSATWCPHCVTLKEFLAEHGIRHSVVEVDRLPESQQERHRATMKRLTGRVAFPTVVVGDQAKAGFSPSWILQATGR
jgi:glutaredoxin